MMIDKSSFIDIVPYVESCSHLEHKPPQYLVIPEDKQYRHVCPGCGAITYVVNANVTC